MNRKAVSAASAAVLSTMRTARGSGPEADKETALAALSAFADALAIETSDIDRAIQSGHVRGHLAAAYAALVEARNHLRTAAEAFKPES